MLYFLVPQIEGLTLRFIFKLHLYFSKSELEHERTKHIHNT